MAEPEAVPSEELSTAASFTIVAMGLAAGAGAGAVACPPELPHTASAVPCCECDTATRRAWRAALATASR